MDCVSIFFLMDATHTATRHWRLILIAALVATVSVGCWSVQPREYAEIGEGFAGDRSQLFARATDAPTRLDDARLVALRPAGERTVALYYAPRSGWDRETAELTGVSRIDLVSADGNVREVLRDPDSPVFRAALGRLPTGIDFQQRFPENLSGEPDSLFVANPDADAIWQFAWTVRDGDRSVRVRVAAQFDAEGTRRVTAWVGDTPVTLPRGLFDADDGLSARVMRLIYSASFVSEHEILLYHWRIDPQSGTVRPLLESVPSSFVDVAAMASDGSFAWLIYGEYGVSKELSWITAAPVVTRLTD